METFFYICDYFEISPKDFFDMDSTNPAKSSELIEIIKSLPNERIDLLIEIGKAIKK